MNDLFKLGAGLTMAGCSLIVLIVLVAMVLAIWGIGC